MGAAGKFLSRRGWLGVVGAALLRGQAGSARQRVFRGIFPIMSTPYTESYEIDWEALEKEVAFLERCGVHGMVWPQLASEYHKLSREERLRGMEIIARVARNCRAALVLGVQDATVEGAVGYARHAEKLGPDAMIAIPPTVARSTEDFERYYETLARVTERPIFIQTTGGARGVEPTVELLVGLARKHPNLGYVKEEYGSVIERMKQLAQYRPWIRAIFSGRGGRALLYELRLGMDGTMPGAAYADLYVRVWEAYQAGRHGEAREVFGKVLLMLNCEEQIPGAREYLLRKRGVTKAVASRLRSIHLDAAAIEEIESCWEIVRPYLRFERI